MRRRPSILADATPTAFYGHSVERDNADELTLTPKGRYLVVVMMRQFFIGVNNLRDQARAALTGEERELIFGDGKDCGTVVAKPASADAVAAEITREEAASAILDGTQAVASGE